MRAAITRLRKWLSAANYAWSMGEAEWVHPDGTSPLMSLAARRLAVFGGDARAMEMAAKGIERICVARGIDLRRHRPHRMGA